MAFRHIFRYIKKTVDDTSHCLQFIFFKVILGNTYIRFYYFSVRSLLPCGQAHVLFLCIRTVNYQFRSGMPMYRIVHFVLHLFVKQPCCGRTFVIIYGRGIYICKFLVKTPFTQSYLTNFGKQMLKIILSDK